MPYYGRRRRRTSFVRKRYSRPSFRRRSTRPMLRSRRRRSWFRRKRSAYYRTDPSQLFTKLRYYDFFPGLGLSASSITAQAFRLNSAYDPDYSGVGGTPTELARIANSYHFHNMCVIAAKVHFRFQHTSNNTMMLGFIPTTPSDTVPGTALQVQQLLNERQYPGVGHIILDSVPANTPLKVVHYKRFYKIRRLIGRKLDFQVPASGTGTDATDLTHTPSNLVNLNVFLIAADGASNLTGGVFMHVWITYYVRFYNRNKTYYVD